MIIEPTKSIQPTHVIFWGVGLTDSDKNLLDLYRRWCHLADQIDFINPSVADVGRARKLLDVDVRRCDDVADWHSRLGQDMK